MFTFLICLILCVYYTDQTAVNMNARFLLCVCFDSLCHKCVTDQKTDWQILYFKICSAAKNHNLIIFILYLSAMRGQKSRRLAVWRRRVSRVSVGWRSPSPLCRRTSTSSSSPARTWWGTPSDSDCCHHYTKPANQCTNQYCQHYTKAFKLR